MTVKGLAENFSINVFHYLWQVGYVLVGSVWPGREQDYTKLQIINNSQHIRVCVCGGVLLILLHVCVCKEMLAVSRRGFEGGKLALLSVSMLTPTLMSFYFYIHAAQVSGKSCWNWFLFTQHAPSCSIFFVAFAEWELIRRREQYKELKRQNRNWEIQSHIIFLFDS